MTLFRQCLRDEIASRLDISSAIPHNKEETEKKGKREEGKEQGR